MEDKHFMAFPLFQPKNRKELRMIKHEYERLSLKLAEIEAAFCREVLNEVTRPYSLSYKIWLDQYIKKCEEIHKKLRPKYIVLNPSYFQEVYSTEPRQIDGSGFSLAITDLVRSKLWFM